MNNYTVWEEHSIPKEVSRDHSTESMNRYFNESILPRLVKRVPSFKDSKVCIQENVVKKWKRRFFQCLIHALFCQLESYDSGVIDVCTWDNNLLIGPILGFYNVLNVGGFGNNGKYIISGMKYQLVCLQTYRYFLFSEFLYAPAVARGMAELILDRDFDQMDLSCFRIERMTSNMKVDDVVESFLMHNKN